MSRITRLQIFTIANNEKNQNFSSRDVAGTSRSKVASGSAAGRGTRFAEIAGCSVVVTLTFAADADSLGGCSRWLPNPIPARRMARPSDYAQPLRGEM
jgi:hypothetical protein